MFISFEKNNKEMIKFFENSNLSPCSFKLKLFSSARKKTPALNKEQLTIYSVRWSVIWYKLYLHLFWPSYKGGEWQQIIFHCSVGAELLNNDVSKAYKGENLMYKCNQKQRKKKCFYKPLFAEKSDK